MPLVVTAVMADRQVVLVAATPFAERLNMLQRGVLGLHMLTTDPARHFAMQLARDRFVDLFAGVSGFTHAMRSRLQVGGQFNAIASRGLGGVQRGVSAVVQQVRRCQGATSSGASNTCGDRD